MIKDNKGITMVNLAIKGHPTRGDEVIEILEMLGGTNRENCWGVFNNRLYLINAYGDIEDISLRYNSNYQIYTLEEFLEKYPYKVGDKVTLDNFPCEIKGMSWEYDDIIYYVKGADFSKGVYSKDKDLQPYKEETMDKAVFDGNAQCCDIMNHLIKKETMEEELIPRIDFNKYCKDKYLLDLGDYEIKEENGKTYAVRKQFEYPKTYEKCCEVLGIDTQFCMKYLPHGTLSYKDTLIYNLQVLLICRDAYWKIAGEQMGLGKSWDSIYGCGEWGYWIGYDINANKIYCQDTRILLNHLLVFPTKEMRDVFKENFDKDIEFCKEFL